MERFVIATGTITHALKGRDLLRKQGFKAQIERMKYGTEKYGCGYAIVLWTNNIAGVESMLKSNNVKVLNISKI